MARRKRKSDEAPGWVWMLFGLGIGLIIAFGVYMNGGPATSAPAASPVAAQPPEEPIIEQPQTAAEVEPSAADAQPAPEAKPEEPVVESQDGEDPNRFGFYDFLASFEVVIPKAEAPAPQTEAVVAIEDPGIYLLQAGSFLTESDAEAQRARLGLLGIESRIQRVPIDDRTFNRVLIGPLEELDELNSIRARLTQANVESLVMKMAQ